MAAVGIVGAGPAGCSQRMCWCGRVSTASYSNALTSGAVRARARAGLIEDRTARLLDAHGLADGMLKRGKTLGSCEFRRGGEGMSSTTGL